MKKENSSHIILTKSQKIAKKKILDFLKSKNKIFLLTGKPGVGKTTIIGNVLKDLLEKDRNELLSFDGSSNINVAGIALAHQAKNVLGKQIPFVYTFAKAYKLKEHIDQETGERKFVYDKYNQDICIGEENIPVFVHDEVSQYTKKMLSIVLEKTSVFSKIIFIGDKAQLPPIDVNNEMEEDEDSPVFDLEIPEECKHELTKRIRQKEGNPILDLSDVIREEIFSNKEIKRVLEIIKREKIINGKGYKNILYSNLLKEVKNEDFLNTCIIAFRNKTINYFNPIIRNEILNFPKRKIVPDDIICMTDNYYHKENGFTKYILYNSDKLEIKNVYKQVKRFFGGGSVYYNIECYVCDLKQTDKKFIVPTEKGSIQFENALSEIANKCKQKIIRWDVFWGFKKQVCYYIYGYAITAYKVQGSTYDNVFVDINDILLTGPLTPKRKLQTIYTAITRARNVVWFLKNG